MFVDKAAITVVAGNGGAGAVAFHREKFIAAGGPDGGDGGRGGSIVVVADPNMSTLMDFRYKRQYTAANGVDGQGKMKAGKNGEDLVLRLPVGTVVKDAASGGVIHDLSDGKPFILAKGGRGGWGNKHFATPTRQAPRFARPGGPGQRRDVILELKLLADVGLAGFPNVGKSTLLAAMSKARPKIADYHFTTLYPNLGVVYGGEGASFVMADIPGLIEGAGEGAGLGFEFLRHIERCRLIVHVVDASGSEGRDPLEDFETINAELARYDERLASRPQIVAANKCDILEDREAVDKLRRRAEESGYKFFEISAAAHTGLSELNNAIIQTLAELPPIQVFEPEYVEPEAEPETAEELDIFKEDGVWNVAGPWLDKLVSRVNFGDSESRMYFDNTLRRQGVFERMEAAGVEEGDTVSLAGVEFEYKK